MHDVNQIIYISQGPKPIYSPFVLGICFIQLNNEDIFSTNLIKCFNKI